MVWRVAVSNPGVVVRPQLLMQNLARMLRKNVLNIPLLFVVFSFAFQNIHGEPPHGYVTLPQAYDSNRIRHGWPCTYISRYVVTERYVGNELLFYRESRWPTSYSSIAEISVIGFMGNVSLFVSVLIVCSMCLRQFRLVHLFLFVTIFSLLLTLERDILSFVNSATQFTVLLSTSVSILWLIRRSIENLPGQHARVIV